MPLPIRSLESVQGTAPSLPTKTTVRFRGEGQVVKVTLPAVAQPQSRRLNLTSRLLVHFVLTWAFVKAANPQIDGQPSCGPCGHAWLRLCCWTESRFEHNKDLFC